MSAADPARRELRDLLATLCSCMPGVCGAAFLLPRGGPPPRPVTSGATLRDILRRLGARDTRAVLASLRSSRRRLAVPAGSLHVEPLAAGRSRVGLLVLLREGNPFTAGERRGVRRAAAAAGRALASREELERIQRSYINNLLVLQLTLEGKDRFARGHSARVAEWCRRAGTALAIPRRELEALNRAALLHDIGKIGIVDTILQKAERLTDEEMAIVREHPVIGQRIVQDVATLREASLAIRHHHERWDGKGYPDGLQGEAIPRAARLLALAETFDSITSDTPYRRGQTAEEATAIIRREKGRQFDPALVDPFLEAVLP